MQNKKSFSSAKSCDICVCGHDKWFHVTATKYDHACAVKDCDCIEWRYAHGCEN